jgi:hypothetical protein
MVRNFTGWWEELHRVVKVHGEELHRVVGGTSQGGETVMSLMLLSNKYPGSYSGDMMTNA